MALLVLVGNKISDYSTAVEHNIVFAVVSYFGGNFAVNLLETTNLIN